MKLSTLARSLTLGGLTLALSGPLLAQQQAGKPPTAPATNKAPEAPRSPAAKDAQTKYERAAQQALIEYQAAITKARRELNESLDGVKKIAMKNGNLEEAVRIDAAMKADPDDHKATASLRDQIIAQKTFIYSWGNEDRVVEFLPNGVMQGGKSDKKWKMNGQTLIIEDQTATEELVLGTDGVFRGTSKTKWQVGLSIRSKK